MDALALVELIAEFLDLVIQEVRGLVEVRIQVTAVQRNVRLMVVGVLDDLQVNASFSSQVVLNKVQDFGVR